MNLFQVLEQYSVQNAECIITSLAEESLGEKVIATKEQILWYSHPHGSFAGKEDQALIKEAKSQGTVNGTPVFVDYLVTQKKLVICGAGHVSIPVVTIGKMTGFEVIVLEDRPLFADHARTAGADRVICDAFEKGLDEIAGDEDTYFVILTRGHRFDRICLERSLQKPSAYVGMIGSKSRVAAMKEALTQCGYSKEQLEGVHAPIGLAIGAETPEEIAVSIMAEIIERKNKRNRNGGFSKKFVENAVDAERSGLKMVMATIVRRHGSAPREVGTKMLILENGAVIGTIGGGCLEAAVGRRARCLISEGTAGAEMFYMDLSGREAEDAGMVCGGEVDVLLECL